MVDVKIKVTTTLLLLTIARETTTGDVHVNCSGVMFHGVYYDKEVIVSGLGLPYNLVLHKFSGMLFFSHNVQNGSQVDFEIVACHIEKRQCNNVKGIAGGYAIAYDPGNDDIYLGGHDGLYKYNFLTKSAEFFAEEGKNIWSIFVRKNFYYIEYPSQKLNIYQDEIFQPVAEAIKIEIDNFFVSKDGDVYFSNKTALYRIEKHNENEPIVLNDELSVRQISEDAYGDIYFSTNEGIFIEDKPYHRIKKVANTGRTFGLTFDERDRPIYSDADAIYKLKPNQKAWEQCHDIKI